MSRTDLLKLGWVVGIGLLALAVIATNDLFVTRTTRLLVVGILLLIPGRIQGVFYRDFFRGRRLLDRGWPGHSLSHNRRFLGQIRQHPWQKRLLWLSWDIYTTDVEAMTPNNIGAAYLELGRWEAATATFQEALTIDPRYPKPHFNLALIAEITGDRAAAEEQLRRAAELGYRDSQPDRLISLAGEMLARVEGHGATRQVYGASQLDGVDHDRDSTA